MPRYVVHLIAEQTLGSQRLERGEPIALVELREGLELRDVYSAITGGVTAFIPEGHGFDEPARRATKNPPPAPAGGAHGVAAPGAPKATDQGGDDSSDEDEGKGRGGRRRGK